MPIKNESFDLVVSNSCFPNPTVVDFEFENEKGIERSLEELLRVTRPGGEIRLGNVLNFNHKDFKNISYPLSMKKFDQILKELKDLGEIDFEKISYNKNKKGIDLKDRVYFLKIKKLVGKKILI